MTNDPTDPIDNPSGSNGDIPELFDRLQDRVSSPDPIDIRSEAGRRGAARRQTLSVVGSLALVAAITGGALWMTRETPTETVTAADGTSEVAETAEELPAPVARSAVADDSAPVSLEGRIELPALETAAAFPTDQWLPIVSMSPGAAIDLDAGSFLDGPLIGGLHTIWISDPVDDQSELIFSMPCASAGYSIRWRDQGFLVDDLGEPSGADATSILGRRAVCDRSLERIDLFELFDSVTFSDDFSTFFVDGSNGQPFTIELGVTAPAQEFETDEVPVIPTVPPTAPSFTSSTRSALEGASVRFTNTSRGDFSLITWHLGDGTTMTGSSVAHSYEAAGMYSVEMIASGPSGSYTTETIITVTK
ncbi:MAG: hypothetical protein ACI81L_002747 [Verrucomicrobiales bacterium]|jgi:hypothetical protein